ncbi:hypothetical protein EBT16_04485 [bacterium]|nr:hypothetical protein [bacterium]
MKFSLILLIALLGPIDQCFGALAPVPSHPGKTLFTPGIAIPIMADSGETGAGLSFGFLSQVDPSSKLYAGADLGLHFWGKALSLTESTTALQLLPTAIYLLGSKPNWVSFIGLSAGAYWYVAQAAGGPGIDFLLLLRPGVMLNLSPSLSLSIEAKYGELGGLFLFMPSVGVNLSL